MFRGMKMDNTSINISGKRKADKPSQETAWSKKSRNVDVLSEAPRELQIVKYAESHAAEIQVLSSRVKIAGSGRNVAQRIPVHIRRRAMSHNVKRLPRSIRCFVKPFIGAKMKKPSRYHRRRPQNLLEEYTRRQRKHIWLETHIWHAKRFHMVDKWGYNLPWKPTMKSERACYRATSRYCLLQDMSYMCCIEIEGQQTVILDALSHVTNPQTGQTVAAMSCLAGTREGNTIMYQYDQYPWHAIGPVSFMWNPSQPIKDKLPEIEAVHQRQLWIWCHPCIFDQIWTELLNCLNLKETKLDKKLDAKDSKGIDENKQPFICDKYKTNVVGLDATKQTRMKSLTGSLLRFRLTGPQSMAVLSDTLQQANIVPFKCSEENDCWWEGYYSNPEHSLGHVTQREFMESVEVCQSPSELPPHCVVAITTRDPRLTRPVKRTKIESDESSICQDMSSFREKLIKDVSVSPLWVENIRDEVASTKITDHKMHQLKSQKLVPGLPLELGDEESRIPVIILQRPGVTSLSNTRGHLPSLGRGSGFDLLLPKGWGMAFWLALVYRGARCAGLREGECNAHEERSLLFPHDFPDTPLGRQHQQDLELEKVEKYNRMPPSKRPNYTKYGIMSPFNCPWNLLVKEWIGKDNSKTIDEQNNEIKNMGDSKRSDISDAVINNDAMNMGNSILCDVSSSSNCGTAELGDEIGGLDESNKVESAADKSCMIYVLRNARLLRQLQNQCEIQNKNKYQKRKADTAVKHVFDVLENEHNCSLVAVKLDLVLKGCPGQFSTICLPTNDDLEQFNGNKSYGGPVEPHHIDPVLVEKKELKKQMKQKGVKKKVRVDRNLKLIGEKGGALVRSGCRDVMGYLNSGGYSLGTGNGGGVGFVCTLGLVRLLRKCLISELGPVVLVRGNSTLQYRFARLSVVI